MVNRGLEKRGTNLFSRCTANISNHGTMWTYQSYETSPSVIKCLGYRQDWMWFECGKQIHLLSTRCSFEKKSRHLTIFPDIVSIFQVFSSSEELLCKFQDFFYEFKTGRTLKKYQLVETKEYWIHWPPHTNTDVEVVEWNIYNLLNF